MWDHKQTAKIHARVVAEVKSHMLPLCIYLFQERLNMTLDHKCQIFQNLNGAVGEQIYLYA